MDREEEIMQGVKDLIGAALHKQQISKAALARKLGMSDDALSGWQRGDVRRLDIINLVRLCESADLSMDALFCLQGKDLGQGTVDIDTLRERAERAEWMLDQLWASNQARAAYPTPGGLQRKPLLQAIADYKLQNQQTHERLRLLRMLQRVTVEALLDVQSEVVKYTVPRGTGRQLPGLQQFNNEAKHG